jgi:hypothetical protein
MTFYGCGTHNARLIEQSKNKTLVSCCGGAHLHAQGAGNPSRDCDIAQKIIDWWLRRLIVVRNISRSADTDRCAICVSSIKLPIA